MAEETVAVGKAVDPELVSEVLGRKEVIPIIMFLDSHGRSKQKDLEAVGDVRDYMVKTLSLLETIGVISIEVKHIPRKTIFYSLTEKGKRLGETFQGLRDIVPEEFAD